MSAASTTAASIAEPRPFTTCGECEKERGHLECLQCHERYCHACAVAVHRRGRRQRHERFVELPPCSECDAVYADVRCTKCDEYYCGACFAGTHSRGRKAALAHRHVTEAIVSGVPTEPPHRAAGAGGRNSFGIAVDQLVFSRFDAEDGIARDTLPSDAVQCESPAPDAAGDAAAGESRPGTAGSLRPRSARKVNVVDGYGRLLGPGDVEEIARETLEAAHLDAPDTETMVLVADGDAIGVTDRHEHADGEHAESPKSPASPDSRMPLTLAQPLSIDPEPVRVPRAVQQGTQEEAIAAQQESLRQATLRAEGALEKLQSLRQYFRTWRRRADGSEAAVGPPVLFAEYKDALTHRPPRAPVRLPPLGAKLDDEQREYERRREAEAESGEPTLVPFFEPTAVKSEFFALAVAAVLASNGHHPEEVEAPTIPASAEDVTAPVETPPFPGPRGDIFAKWIAAADRFAQHELLSCRFFVAPGSAWERRHDASAPAGEGPEGAPAGAAAHAALAVPSHFVTVDSLLPAAEDRRPAFGRTEDRREMWLALLMKAYAVAHPHGLGVASLHLDTPAAAFEALTGGAVSLARWRMNDPAAVGTVWWLLQLCAQFHLPCIMCRRPAPADAETEGESEPASSVADRNERPETHRSGDVTFTPIPSPPVAASSRPVSRTSISTPPPLGSRAGSSMRVRSPGNEVSADTPVVIDSDGGVDRFEWLQGDVMMAACEYRFDTGVAEALADLDDVDADARSTSSVGTALTTASAFHPGGSSGATELHRLVKLRQLYGGSRAEDETGWLPTWHDDSNVWTDVVSAVNVGGGLRSRAASVASAATVSSSAQRAAAGSVNARWSKATRRALQHPSPDERMAWMDAATFASKYNTLMIARNLAQHSRYKLHFGLVDRTVRREEAAARLPAFLLHIQKRDTGTAGNAGNEGWRADVEARRGTGIADLLADADMDADFGFNSDAAVGVVETDDEEADDDAADDERSVTSSRMTSSVNEAPGAAKSTSSLVMRITVSQPARTASAASNVPLGSSVRSNTLRAAQLASPAQRVVAAPPPPPLELQAFRAAAAERIPCIQTTGGDGVQVASLPAHSRLAVRCVSTAVNHDAVEAVYELEANTGFYNLVVAPATGDEVAAMSLSQAASVNAQPFAITVAMVRNAPSYEIRTEAL